MGAGNFDVMDFATDFHVAIGPLLWRAGKTYTLNRH
jgi:hypothetical protein